MGLASCVPTAACRFSDRAVLHLPFHSDRFPVATSPGCAVAPDVPFFSSNRVLLRFYFYTCLPLI